MRSDTELLASYASSGDEDAFAEIASRHGGMVYRVCLSVLGDAHEAEDASQATFLVFSHKARGLRRKINLAAWLYGTARRVALWTARTRAARKRNEEAAAMAKNAKAISESNAPDTEELCAEVDRLPVKLRQAVLLRYIEELSQQDAAAAAACPQGTLGRRASEGLELLRERLVRRGFALSVTALTALLRFPIEPAVPESLLPSILAVPKLAATGAATGTAAVIIAKGVLKTMFWNKMIASVTAVVAVLALATPLAVKALSGEPAAEADKPAAAAAPVPAVDGLRLTLSLEPDPLVCSKECGGQAADPRGGYVKCSTCENRHRASCKMCPSCALIENKCEVCDKVLPAGVRPLTTFKAGESLRLVLTFENVSEQPLKICNYMLGYWLIKWDITGPDKDSVKTVRTGIVFKLVRITAKHFPEIAPGKKLVFCVSVSDNPPTINQGTHKTSMLVPGKYTVVATYKNDRDTLPGFDPVLKMATQVKVPGNVWKGSVNSQKVEFEITGQVQPLP